MENVVQIVRELKLNGNTRSKKINKIWDRVQGEVDLWTLKSGCKPKKEKGNVNHKWITIRYNEFLMKKINKRKGRINVRGNSIPGVRYKKTRIVRCRQDFYIIIESSINDVIWLNLTWNDYPKIKPYKYIWTCLDSGPPPFAPFRWVGNWTSYFKRNVLNVYWNLILKYDEGIKRIRRGQKTKNLTSCKTNYGCVIVITLKTPTSSTTSSKTLNLYGVLVLKTISIKSKFHIFLTVRVKKKENFSSYDVYKFWERFNPRFVQPVVDTSFEWYHTKNHFKNSNQEKFL